MAHPPPPRAIVVAILGSGQILSWASSFYLPAVIADPLCAGLHVKRTLFFGIFSASLLLSGLLGPLAGRMIDRSGGRDVLALASLLFAAGLIALSRAVGPASLALAWTLLAAGMGFGLYEAAFATAAGLYGTDARGAITGITLFGGFASTIGWPASAAFIHAFGWRGACLAWAALNGLVCLPMILLLVPKPQPPGPVATGPQPAPVTANRTMILLAAIFGASWFVATAMAAHLPRLLIALGASPALALTAASLLGPAQVGARLIEFSLLRRVGPLVSARCAAALHPLGALLLALAGPPAAIAFTVLHGAGNGIMTIARGTLPLAMFGPASYGLRTGWLSAPARILQGGAPLLFSLVLDRDGPRAALTLSGSIGLAACLGLLLLRAPRREADVRTSPSA